MTAVALKNPLINIHSLVSVSVFLFARDVGQEALATNPDRRQYNENDDRYLSLYHRLRLFSATDFDDIFV